jgi:predicted nucleic acid-binding Zn ribbon protein
VSDPFTDFMTGKLSERHAKQDRRIFAMMYFGITALIVLAIVTLFI